MKKTINSHTVVAFLRARGWELYENAQYFYYLIPPNYIKFEDKNFKWQIPKVSTTSTYDRFMEDVLKDIVQMYDVKIEEIREFFTRPPKRIKQEIELSKNMEIFV